MRPFLRSACAPTALLLGCIVALIGCGGTREDRTITFSKSGDQVGFQHGRDGVYVANKEGGGLTKVFTPDRDVIAVGTPLWAPNDKRLIFTTARAIGKDNALPIFPGTEEDPAGRVFLEQPAEYTCWLRDEPKGDAAPEPRKLFTTQVGFIGYVAAGLAVRWHPHGDRVLYVKQIDGGGHAVFEFDLGTGQSHRVFPARDTAQAVLFDWSPDGAHLACVLVNQLAPEDNGIWVGRDGADWWHVSESCVPPCPGATSLLESLRATRPVWTNDGARFAFATSAAAKPNDPIRSSLRLAIVADRRAKLLLEERGPIRDLAWRPDGERLGFLCDGDRGLLRVADRKGEAVTVTTKAVRTFAGWEAQGRHLAYTTAADVPLKREDGRFCLLFSADPLARDVLWIAPGDGRDAGHSVVSGLRTTFANWSPKDEKLSLWFTFCPTHGSLFSRGLGWGLRPGDPAAVIDATTKKISWMAVNANEMAQVGHYYLLKRDHDTAWSWYEKARKDRAAQAEPEERRSGWEAVRPRPFRDVSFFEYYCLDKLGRREEAKKRLAQFRDNARRLLPSDEDLDTFPLRMGNDKAKSDQWLRNEVRSLVPLARDFYAAEVFLSLDAAADGEAFFRKALAEAANDEDRLSAAVVLSQLLLLEGKANDYATVVVDSLAPLAAKSCEPAAGQPLNPPIPVSVAGLAILPLANEDLLARLSDERVDQWVTFTRSFREKSRHDGLKLVADDMLLAAYGRLGRQKEKAEARERQRTNPCFGQGLWAGGPKVIDEQRATLEQFGLMTLLTVRALNTF
jgi:hypothetical protein